MIHHLFLYKALLKYETQTDILEKQMKAKSFLKKGVVFQTSKQKTPAADCGQAKPMDYDNKYCLFDTILYLMHSIDIIEH